MKFRHVKFKNFLSYGDEEQVLDLSKSGITLVIGENKKEKGSNGAGKSAATVESIVYGLYGKTTKKLKADEAINNKTNKDCYVEVAFSIGNDNYCVKRYRSDTKNGNSLIFEKNGEDFSGDGKIDTQSKIEDTLKISYKSFISSIVLSQEKISNFAESDSLERRKIIENLLMYDFISRFHKTAKEVLRTIGPEIKSLSESKKEKEESAKTLTENLLSYVSSKENDFTKKQKSLEELKSEKDKIKSIDITKELETIEKVNSINLEIDELTRSMNDLDSSVKSLERKKKELNSAISDRSTYIENIEKDIETCPLCGNIIEEEKMRNHLNEKREELSVFLDEAEKARLELSEKKKGLFILEKKSVEKKSKLKTLLKESCNMKEQDLREIEKRVNNIEVEIGLLEKSTIDLDSDQYIMSTTELITKKKREIKKIDKKIKRFEEDQSYYEWWKNALSNSTNSLKSFCINHILLSLNKYINYYLAHFGYDIEYTLDEELEDIIIKDGEKISFGNLSGGEKRSIEVSLVFALYEIVKLKLPDTINIIVLDELLSTNFDEVRIKGAIDILTELEERRMGIFVIDHKSSLKDNLDCETLVVTKDKQGFSTLEN